MIHLYDGDRSRYLNFYGPPGTIETYSLHQVLDFYEKGGVADENLELKDKVVFVGLSERMRPEQRDGFHTVFTMPNGVDLSGVEIAATAFGNILENRHIQTFDLKFCAAVCMLWGFFLGTVCTRFSPFLSAPMISGVAVVYLVFVQYRFNHEAVWHPLVVPLLLQAPAAFFGVLLWKYARTHRERHHIKHAFQMYLPESVVNQLITGLSRVKPDERIVYGTCLSTDAEKYSLLAEKLDPVTLHDLMNRYYEAVFQPVRKNGGIVSDVVGDSMMAVWTATIADVSVRRQACVAALEISQSVRQFNRRCETTRLPTRIGIHFGKMLIGSIGAVDHYEYRAVGDIINTVTRIEGLNKHLGTKILASAEVLDRMEGFTVRFLGKFLLAGKSRPIEIYELMAQGENRFSADRQRITNFESGLQAFFQRNWSEAIRFFDKNLSNGSPDGPSLFYRRICERYRLSSPSEKNWQDGVIFVATK